MRVLGGSLLEADGQDISEDDELTLEVSASDSGAGIEQIMLACKSTTSFGCARGDGWLGAFEGAAEILLNPSLGSEGAATWLGATQILDVAKAPCTDAGDELAPGRLNCPKTWRTTLNLNVGDLLESGGDVFEVLAMDASGAPHVAYDFNRMQRFGNFGSTVVGSSFDVDTTEPEAPDSIELSAVDGLIDAQWDDPGDLTADDPSSEGSGIKEFIARYKIAGETWSDQSTLSADKDWGFTKNIGLGHDGEGLQFEVIAVDYAGHESDPTLESTTIEDRDSGESSTDVAELHSVIAPYWPQRTMRLSGEWNRQPGQTATPSSIQVDLFGATVNVSQPDTPQQSASKNCSSSSICWLDHSYPLVAGQYRTRIRAVFELSGGTTNTVESWSDVYAVPAVPDDFDFASFVTSNEIESSPTPESSADDESASVAASRPYLSGCWYPWLHRPNHFGTTAKWPKQYSCRYGAPSPATSQFKTAEKLARKAANPAAKSSRRALQKGPIDNGMLNAYPKFHSASAKKLWQFPRKLRTRGLISVGAAGEKGWALYDTFGTVRALLKIETAGREVIWSVKSISDPAAAWHPAYTLQKAKVGGKLLATDLVKVQGKACFAGGAPSAGYPALAKKDAVLIKIDAGPPEQEYRFFITAKTFDRNVVPDLMGTRVYCSQKHPRKSLGTVGLKDPGTETTLKFKQSKPNNPKKAPDGKFYSDFRSFRTYNEQTLVNRFYISANTSNVFKGGIARAVVPAPSSADGAHLKFKILGYNGYCDINAYFTTRTTILDSAGNPIIVDGAEAKRDIAGSNTQGLQWAFGMTFLDTAPSKKIYGWVPMNALEVPPGGWTGNMAKAVNLDCYRPPEA